MSFIVCGFYLEHRRWKQEFKSWFNFIGGDHFHLVEICANIYTWSVFMAGPPKPGRVWGMLRPLQDFMQTISDDKNAMVFVPYVYGADDHNPPPGNWWDTYPRGKDVQRERRDYVRAV
jgi:hypothetical protein